MQRRLEGLTEFLMDLDQLKLEGHFTLKKKDKSLVEFALSSDKLGGVYCRIVGYSNKKLLPYNFDLNSNNLLRWLESRFVPKNRAFVEKIMATVKDDGPRLVRLLKTTMGLSLIDDYWVVQDNSLKWSDYNLYNNQFSEALSLIAFTGYADNKVDGISSSPEYTTDGMLRKSWRRVNGKVVLYKGGTSGYSNAGLEPYSEYYATQVAEVMGLDYVSYELEKWKGILCSTCPLFTSQDVSFVNAARVLNGRRLLEAMTTTLNSEDMTKIIEMTVFDFIVVNKDRHAGNYGWLRSNDTGKLVGVAPIFDNGDSLLSYVPESELNTVDEYLSDKFVTAFYIDANSAEVLKGMTSREEKNKVKKLLNFEFEKHPKYNLSDYRLRILSNLVRHRARMLL